VSPRVNGVALGAKSPLLTPAGARRLLHRSEADDQKALMELLVGPAIAGERRRPGLGLTWKHPELSLVYAINPNKGGQSSKAARGMAKAMGQLADMPDLHLPVMRGPFIGLYIELKREGGRSTPEQRALHAELRAQGHCVIECHGVEEGLTTVLGYLALPTNRPSARAVCGPGLAPGLTLDQRIEKWRAAATALLTPLRQGER